jgi:arylsulfatase A-like enzyme
VSIAKRTSRDNRQSLLVILIIAGLASLIIFRGVPRKPNVLWITLDSCRHDHLGSYGYLRAHTPKIDAPAQQGAVFSQAISQASNTRASVPSMVTGRYPLLFQARGFALELNESHKTAAEV